MHDDIKGLSDRDILMEILSTSRLQAAAMGTVQAEIKELQKVKDAVKGNGGGMEEGLEFRTLMLEKFEKECPGRNIEAFKTEMFSRWDDLKIEFDAIKKIMLLKKGERVGAAEERQSRKKVNNIIGEFVSAKPVQSALILLLSGTILSVGTCLGVVPKKMHDHQRAAQSAQSEQSGQPEQPVAVVTEEGR